MRTAFIAQGGGFYGLLFGSGHATKDVEALNLVLTALNA